jgi:hypothetical protein
MMERWRPVLIGVALALALGAILYFGGRWQERGQVVAVQEDLDGTRAQLELAEDRIRLLRARSLLLETAVDLERRNFGTASQHLESAADELAAVRRGGPAMDMQELHSLQRDVAATDLNVATDLQVQRTQVLGFVTRLDALMPD